MLEEVRHLGQVLKRKASSTSNYRSAFMVQALSSQYPTETAVPAACSHALYTTMDANPLEPSTKISASLSCCGCGIL